MKSKVIMLFVFFLLSSSMELPAKELDTTAIGVKVGDIFHWQNLGSSENVTESGQSPYYNISGNGTYNSLYVESIELIDKNHISVQSDSGLNPEFKTEGIEAELSRVKLAPEFGSTIIFTDWEYWKFWVLNFTEIETEEFSTWRSYDETGDTFTLREGTRRKQFNPTEENSFGGFFQSINMTYHKTIGVLLKSNIIERNFETVNGVQVMWAEFREGLVYLDELPRTLTSEGKNITFMTSYPMVLFAVIVTVLLFRKRKL